MPYGQKALRAFKALRRRALTLDLIEDGHFRFHVHGLHKQLPAVDDMPVQVVIEAAGAFAEGIHHVCIERDGFPVPPDMIGAAGGAAVGAVQGLVIRRAGDIPRPCPQDP